MVFRVHYKGVSPERIGASLGAILTVVYSAECKASQKAARPAAMLPILVVLFIFSYGLLTMLVFEQGQTIESQRGLIREMLKDSTQLAALKGKLAKDEFQRSHDKVSVQANQKSSAPAAAAPKASSPAAPDTKSSDKDAKRRGKSAHSTQEAPGKPAADLEDVRRATRVI